MIIKTPYECYLAIPDGGKGIPYGGGPRPNGEINHGFRPLKGRADEVASVPETADDSALGNCLRCINADETMFFTVGCVSGKVFDENDGHRMTGYVEFAINDRAMVNEGVMYFQVFWHFVQSLKTTKFSERVTMHWELIGASFLDAHCHGMTCSVVVNTHYHETPEQACECWTKTLDALAAFLVSLPAQMMNRIY